MPVVLCHFEEEEEAGAQRTTDYKEAKIFTIEYMIYDVLEKNK